jgi:hypothetical protein
MSENLFDADKCPVSPRIEAIWRDLFAKQWRHVCGCYDEEEVRRDWERFKAAELPAIVERHPLGEPGRYQEVFQVWFMETWFWLLDEVLVEALTGPGGDFFVVNEPRPDGTVRRLIGVRPVNRMAA